MMKIPFVLVSLLLLVSMAANLYLFKKLPGDPPASTPRQKQDAAGRETNTRAADLTEEPNSATQFEQGMAFYDSTHQANTEAQTSRATLLRTAKTWLRQDEYAQLSRFLQDYLKNHPQDIDFLLLEADLIAQTSLLSEAVIHYYSLLELPMTEGQHQYIQDTIQSLCANTISQLEKAYSWDVLAIFVEPLLQIDPDNRPFILALAQAYAEQQQANLMENTLAALPFNDPQALAIRAIIQTHQTPQTAQNTPEPEDIEDAPQTAASPGVSLNKFGDQYVLSAQLSGNKVELVIDTGATITAIDVEYYQRLSRRFNTHYMGRFKVSTANGSLMAPMYQFAELRVGHRKVEDIAVMVLPMEGLDNADGLLGMNFLREFDFRIDQRKALLFLK